MISSPSLPDALHGIERKLIAVLLIMGWCCVGWPQSGQAQGTSTARPPSPPTSSRMGVIESKRSFENSSVYTIVGAVQRSGAYHSKEDTVSLEQLLRAAGGLAPDASPILRIIRNGQLRFQVTYDSNNPNSSNRLIPGDIVVALSPPTTTEPSTVPVACVGLSHHTVVLPLDPAIQNVNELAARLGQSGEVARAARTISPTGDAHGRLLSGSVIIFPVSLVDRFPLQQPGFLPPTLELKDFVNPNSRAADASALPIGNEFELTSPDPVRTQQAVPRSSVAPSGLTVPEDEPLSAPAVPQVETPKVSHLASPPLLQAAPMLTAIEAEHDGGAPSVHLFRQPHIEGIGPGRVTSTAGVSDNLSERSPLVYADERSQFDAIQRDRSGMNYTPESQSNLRLELSATVPPNNLALLPIVRNPGFPAQIPFEHAANASANLPDEIPINKATSSSFSWKFVFGIALTLTCAFGGAWFWATFRSRQVTGITVSMLTQQSMLPAAEQQVEDPIVAPVATCQEVSPPLLSNAVSDIVERRIPMVEEQVVVPCQWPLQGSVQGFRRLILNAPHASVPAPHFNVAALAGKSAGSRSPTRSVDERQLRQDLKAVIAELNSANAHRTGNVEHQVDGPHYGADSGRAAPVHSTPVHGAPVGTVADDLTTPRSHPVNTPTSISAPLSPIHDEVMNLGGNGGEFDIVQPELPHPIAKSPLERALRTLASEKRG